MAETKKVELTCDAIENGDYETLLDIIDGENDGIAPGESKTITIELTIKNDEEPETEEASDEIEGTE